MGPLCSSLLIQLVLYDKTDTITCSTEWSLVLRHTSKGLNKLIPLGKKKNDLYLDDPLIIPQV